jgi:glycosyltransferase involved in cell wall biosynthesis
MSGPLVTIITPTYNHERFIGPCVESVIAQTYTRWEQVVVDDGSTDRTAQIVASYADPRVRCIRLPHRGLAKLAETYNAALDASRGELVAVLEGDDRWPAGKLEAQVASFRDGQVILSWGRATAIDENGARVRELASLATDEPWLDLDAGDAFARLTRINLFAPAPSVVARRSALDAISGFRQDGSSLYVDLPTWLWLTATARPGERVRFHNRELAHYRVHRQQATHQFRRRMDSEHVQIVDAVTRQLNVAALERLRWSELRRGVRVASRLTEGIQRLGDRHYTEAARSFFVALRESDRWLDRAKSALGLVSAGVHADLLSRAYRARSDRRSARPESTDV